MLVEHIVKKSFAILDTAWILDTHLQFRLFNLDNLFYFKISLYHCYH